MAGITPRPQPMRPRDRWAMAIPVVFALLLTVSFGLFGVGATTAAPCAAAEFASPSRQIGQSTVSAKLNSDWRFTSGPDHTCDICDAHHRGVYHPNYCYESIKKGDTPVLADYGHGHAR
jgi:hypothetical protein